MNYIKVTLLVFIIILTSVSCKKDDVNEVESFDYIASIDGEELLNNTQKTYNTVGDEAADMKVIIKNISSETIKFRLKVIDIQGDYLSESNLLYFCVGTSCYTKITEVGMSFPILGSGQSLLAVDSGQTTNDSQLHFQNKDDNSGDLSFQFKLYQVDDDGNELTSKKSVQFTYKYVAP